MKKLRLLAAVLLVVAAINHGRLAAMGAENATRHAVFVGLNLVLAAAVAFFPRIALFLTVLMSLQQIPSHGGDLLRQTPFDWASLGVVIFFPALILLLALDWRTARRTRRPREAP